MFQINVKKLGFTFGLTGALIYLGCMIVMISAGKEGSIGFFNNFFHGLDTTSVIKLDVPLTEALIGIIQTFILGWLMGACIGAFYNVQIKVKE